MATSLQAFDGQTLEDALARVTEECGPNARITHAEKVRTGGVAGFFARERFEVVVEIDDEDGADGDGPVGVETVAPEPMSLLELADQVSDRERAVTDPVTAPPPPSTDRLPSTEGSTFQEVLRGIVAQAGLLDAEAPGAAPDRTQTDAELFASLGIPRDLLTGPTRETTVAQRLLAVLERVPAAPPVIARRGDVVAVVGVGAAALDAAAGLARQVGQTGDDVVVAAPEEQGFQSLHDATSAEQRVQLWRRCGVPFVVAVCSPAGPWGEAWARDMVEALAPVTTWGAVSAERKPEDIVRWVGAVGGVDALAVGGCEATASPAAVLATGIPVASLEGRRATPAAWTAMLVERLSA